VIVVSDTSAILNLAVVGRVELLLDLFVEIVVPPSVADELARREISLASGWMRVIAAQDRREVARLRQRLDPGEAEAIIVAVEIKAGLILVDERRGRRLATERGLEVMGLLGVLLEAKRRGLISECKPVLDAMIDRAGFWISDELRSRVLLGVGESA
jgi:predicted nucleic acid-binding protein